jgi:arylsulfatase A-like enzyme
MFLHYADPHSDTGLLPYDAPEPYGSMFTEEIGGGFIEIEGRRGGSLYLKDISNGLVEVSEQEIEYIKALYDGGIRYTDVHIGSLVDAMDGMGVLDNTILVIISDHGEEFKEHGMMLHGRVYRESVHVPLIMRFPEAAWKGVRIPAQVRLIDIVPTVLDYSGLPIREEMHGESLLPLIQEGGSHRPAFTEGGDSYAMRTDDWLLITDLDLAEHELYNVNADPGETFNLAGQSPQREDQLLRALGEIVSLTEAGTSTGDTGPARLDRRTREQLKALGYIDQGG